MPQPISKEVRSVIIGLYRQGNDDFEIAKLLCVNVYDVQEILQPIKDKVKKNKIIYSYPLNLN